MATENRNLSAYDKDKVPNASELRFGIVVSEWNEEITEGLYSGALNALIDCGAKEENMTICCCCPSRHGSKNCFRVH